MLLSCRFQRKANAGQYLIKKLNIISSLPFEMMFIFSFIKYLQIYYSIVVVLFLVNFLKLNMINYLQATDCITEQWVIRQGKCTDKYQNNC